MIDPHDVTPLPTEVDVWCIPCGVDFSVDAVIDGGWIEPVEEPVCPECGQEVMA